jgi:hypothetical protein
MVPGFWGVSDIGSCHSTAQPWSCGNLETCGNFFIEYCGHVKLRCWSALCGTLCMYLFMYSIELHNTLQFSDLLITYFLTYLLTYLLTHSMVQSPSWEANWFAASQEIPRIPRYPNVHPRTHKCPPPVSILGQTNPVHIPTSHLLEIHPNTIHPSTSRSPQWFLSPHI